MNAPALSNYSDTIISAGSREALGEIESNGFAAGIQRNLEAKREFSLRLQSDKGFEHKLKAQSNTPS